MENVIIIGSGPAGYTAALYTARANLAPLLLEGEVSQEILPGGQLMTTTEVENYPGYSEGVTGPDMMDDFKKQAARFGTRIISKTMTQVDLSSSPTLKTNTLMKKTASNKLFFAFINVIIYILRYCKNLMVFFSLVSFRQLHPFATTLTGPRLSFDFLNLL